MSPRAALSSGLLLGLISVALLAAAGCGHRSAPKAQPAAAQTLLPEWAPKHPSPEFLRAAKVLKQMPERTSQTDLMHKAFWARYDSTLPAAWEFFGSLSDEQIADFLKTKDLRLRFRSLSAKQQSLLRRYFAVWAQAMKGLPEKEHEWGQDWLVDLYKAGAREDLSNVLVTFQDRYGHGRVAMFLYVVQADGKLSPPFPAGLGDL